MEENMDNKIINPREIELTDYIATQISNDNLDELQKMTIAYALGLNIALDGPPGVGKTESVLNFARILGKNVYEKSCSEDTTENQIISFPILKEENGATITAQENGPLCKAMLEGAIFYGDEFNLLKKDKQKKLNPAFDDRKRIHRADDIEIKAQKGFCAIISYNPTKSLSILDLEDSIADRFIHINYKYMPCSIESYIGALRSTTKTNYSKIPPEMFSIKLEKRAIILNDKQDNIDFRFLVFDPELKTWINFFTGINEDKTVNSVKKIIDDYKDKSNFRIAVYYCYKSDMPHVFNKETTIQDERIKIIIEEFSSKMSKFFIVIRDMMKFGSSKIPGFSKCDLINVGEFGEIVVHPPSLRILSAAISHIIILMKRGMSAETAKSYAANLIIDQICFGKYRDRKTGDVTNYELVSSIARSFGFNIENFIVFNTNFNKKVS